MLCPTEAGTLFAGTEAAQREKVSKDPSKVLASRTIQSSKLITLANHLAAVILNSKMSRRKYYGEICVGCKGTDRD